MYAYQLTGPDSGHYVELDRPRPTEGEVLIRTHAVGICGTDVEMLRGTMPYLMAAGKLKVKPLITHRVDLAEAPRAFELQQSADDERVKIHLKPPESE